MRRVVIVEDETAAAVNLRSMLSVVLPDAEVVEVLESVAEAVEYFSSGADADIVFMDIHLAVFAQVSQYLISGDGVAAVGKDIVVH